ncbi:MAG: helix-turn-helix transcriptional regulator [Coriobacteriaceae bacterium]|nr:helix-turn-helix transcriptional regulator [Coriobacteriaceae bacterium]
MAQTRGFVKGLSLRRITGFACNQGFVFFLFYMGLNREARYGVFSFERIDLIGALFFMLLAFLVLRAAPSRMRTALLARPFILLCALMLAMGSLIPYFFEQVPGAWLLVESVLTGLPCACLLAAWGRAFDEASTTQAVPEVFFASFLGALFGLLVFFIPISKADLAFRVLPFVSAIALMGAVKPSEAMASTHLPGTSALLDRDDSRETALLSVKILVGTLLFGMAAGFMETFNTDPGMAAMPNYAIALLLFAAFAAGTLSLLFVDGLKKGVALNRAYRVAVFVMLMGFLTVPAPFFVGSLVSGEAVVLAGYLGLSAVLISLFLVLAALTRTSVLASFSRGFAALFGGELVGVVLANACNTAQPGMVTPYFVVVFAGLLVLFSYVFLFTERDFDSLSKLVTHTDDFELRCQAIIGGFGLSGREAEVLPFILKGRTSERIAQELYITKSTVDTHLRRIYAKAGVHSRQDLIDLSEQLGNLHEG